MLLNYLTYVMMAFATLSFVSIALGNVLLGLATALFLVYVYKNGIKIEEEHKGYYYAYGFFVFTLLLSALFSGDLKKGLAEWANLCIWRAMPFFIITLAIKDAVRVKKILAASLVGITIGFLCIGYQAYHGSFRAAGFYGHPMTFGGFLCVYLPLITVWFFESLKLKNEQTIISAIVLALGLMAWLFNATRGAWVALAPVLLFIIGYYSWRNKKVMALCLVLLCAGGGYLVNNPRFVQRTASIVSQKDGSNRARFIFWNKSIKVFKEHSVLGVGLGQAKRVIKASKEYKPYFTHYHSNIFQMLAENGVVGLIGYLGFMGYFFLKNFKEFLSEKYPHSLILAASTLAIFIQGITEYNFGNSAVMKAFWMVIGCLVLIKANGMALSLRKRIRTNS